MQRCSLAAPLTKEEPKTPLQGGWVTPSDNHNLQTWLFYSRGPRESEHFLSRMVWFNFVSVSLRAFNNLLITNYLNVTCKISDWRQKFWMGRVLDDSDWVSLNFSHKFRCIWSFARFLRHIKRWWKNIDLFFSLFRLLLEAQWSQWPLVLCPGQK